MARFNVQQVWNLRTGLRTSKMGWTRMIRPSSRTMSSCSRRCGSTVAGCVDAHLCCRMSQVGIELFSCGAAITDGFPSVSCQRIRRYHSSNRCAKLSICRRPNDPRAGVRTGTCWRRTRASSAGKSAGAQPPTTAGIERTTAGAVARRSGRLNAPALSRRSRGGTSEALRRNCPFPAAPTFADSDCRGTCRNNEWHD